MNVKQPVYESSSRSGVGRRWPVGPTLPDFIMPMSLLTYVQTSSECPSFSAIAMYSAVLPRIADCSALISGSTGRRSKLQQQLGEIAGHERVDDLLAGVGRRREPVEVARDHLPSAGAGSRPSARPRAVVVLALMLRSRA